MRRRMFSSCLFAACAAAGPGALRAEAAWPTRPIRLIVPYPAGGPIDRLVRIVAPALGEELGQSIIIDNKAGASAVIGVDATAKAAPDGYSFGMGAGGALAVLPHLTKLPYDPDKIGYVTLMFTVPQVLAVGPKVSAKTLQELIRLATRHPGKLNFGSPGNATTPHLAGLLLATQAGIDIVHVPYKGAGPAMTALLGGEIEMVPADLAAIQPFLSQGVRVLAILGPKRVEQLPDVPSAAEVGLPGLRSESYYGLIAPAGIPPAIIQTMRHGVIAALERPGVRAQIKALGAAPSPSTPEEYATLRRQEFQRWGTVIKNQRIKLD